MNGKVALFCCLLCVSIAEKLSEDAQQVVLIGEGKGTGPIEIWINGEPAFFANRNFRITIAGFPLKDGTNYLRHSGLEGFSISLVNAISGDALAQSPDGRFSIHGCGSLSERHFSPLDESGDANPFLLLVANKINRALVMGDRTAFAKIFEGDHQVTSAVFPPGVYRERQWLLRSSIDPAGMRVVYGTYFAMVMPDMSKLEADQAWLTRLLSDDFMLEPKSYLFARNQDGKWVFYPNAILYGRNPSAFIIKQPFSSDGTP